MRYFTSRLLVSQADWLTVAVDKTSGVDFRHEDGTLLYPHFLGFMSFVWRFLPVTSFWKILAFPVTGIYSLLGKRDFTILFFDTNFRAFLHWLGGPQVGEVKCGRSPHLSCKRDQIKMRDDIDRRVTPPKQVTSPTWGLPPPCKQAVRHIWQYVLRQGN